MAKRNILQLRRATRIVAKLRGLKREIGSGAFEHFVELHGDGGWTPLPVVNIDDPRLSLSAKLIHHLDNVLAEAGFRSAPSEELTFGEFWTIGSVLRTAPIRTIHCGFLQPMLHVPLLRRVPDRVVAFIIEIPNDRDLLQREHHDHVGWHYHYLDSKKSRSDVVLCWDTKAPYDPSKQHPLFQEKHGESHAKFTARPDLWGDTKRQSMHTACVRDLNTRPMHEFRCASKKAGPVWPKNIALTPPL